MRSSATAMSGLSFRCCGGGGRDVVVPGQFLGVDAAELRQVVLEGGRYGAARHVVGEFFQADLAAGGGEFQRAQTQHVEVVAHHVGVVRVVGDEDDAEAAVA